MLYSSPVPTSIDPSEFGCSLMEEGRYRTVRLSFHTSNVSGDATSALREMTGGSEPRASVRRVSRGANCLHLLQFALVVLSRRIDETKVSGNEAASPACESAHTDMYAYFLGVCKVNSVERRISRCHEATVHTRICCRCLDPQYLLDGRWHSERKVVQ